MQMPSLSQTKVASILVCSLTLIACGPPDESSRVKTGPIDGSFIVSEFFTPSGNFGDGEFPGRLITEFNVNCKQPRPAGAKGDCYRFTYYPNDVLFAGTYWVSPANSWGAVPGRSVIGSQDLSAIGPGLRGYDHVRFSAATDARSLFPPTPEQPSGHTNINMSVAVGGIDGTTIMPPYPKLPYKDRSCNPAQAPDNLDQTHCSDFKVTSGLALTTEWQTKSIDISGTPLTEVIGAFAWSINYLLPLEGAPPQYIYIDDLVWE